MIYTEQYIFSECGISLYNENELCSACLESVKSEDKKYYSCGRKLEGINERRIDKTYLEMRKY